MLLRHRAAVKFARDRYPQIKRALFPFYRDLLLECDTFIWRALLFFFFALKTSIVGAVYRGTARIRAQ